MKQLTSKLKLDGFGKVEIVDNHWLAWNREPIPNAIYLRRDYDRKEFVVQIYDTKMNQTHERFKRKKDAERFIELIAKGLSPESIRFGQELIDDIKSGRIKKEILP